MSTFKYHTLKVPKELQKETSTLLLQNLDKIKNLVDADDVGIEYKEKTITILIKRKQSYQLNKLSEFLDEILPPGVIVPYWG